MINEENAERRHRQRATELRRMGTVETHPDVRNQLFQMAAEYDRLAVSAAALEGMERYKQSIKSAEILPFRPRASSL